MDQQLNYFSILKYLIESIINISNITLVNVITPEVK